MSPLCLPKAPGPAAISVFRNDGFPGSHCPWDLARNTHGQEDYCTKRGGDLEQPSLLYIKCVEKLPLRRAGKSQEFPVPSGRPRGGRALSFYGDFKVGEGQVSQNLTRVISTWSPPDFSEEEVCLNFTFPLSA